MHASRTTFIAGNSAIGAARKARAKILAAAAPRFSGTPALVGTPPVPTGADTRTVLAEWGIAEGLISSVTDIGTIS